MLDDECLVDLSQDIDDGVPDAHHVQRKVSHGLSHAGLPRAVGLAPVTVRPTSCPLHVGERYPPGRYARRPWPTTASPGTSYPATTSWSWPPTW